MQLWTQRVGARTHSTEVTRFGTMIYGAEVHDLFLGHAKVAPTWSCSASQFTTPTSVPQSLVPRCCELLADASSFILLSRLFIFFLLLTAVSSGGQTPQRPFSKNLSNCLYWKPKGQGWDWKQWRRKVYTTRISHVHVKIFESNHSSEGI